MSTFSLSEPPVCGLQHVRGAIQSRQGYTADLSTQIQLHARGFLQHTPPTLTSLAASLELWQLQELSQPLVKSTQITGKGRRTQLVPRVSTVDLLFFPRSQIKVFSLGKVASTLRTQKWTRMEPTMIRQPTNPIT